MASTLDIFGLGLGAAYAALAPIVAYLVLRIRLDLKLRDIALGALGYLASDTLYRLAVRPGVDALLAVWQQSGYRPNAFVFFFVDSWSFRSAFAIESELLCFLLLSLFASPRKGMGPGVAYAIGAYGVFGVGVRATEFPTQIFAYGIPYGAGSVTQLLVTIGLSILVWRAVLEKKRTWLWLAILIDVGLQTPYSILAALLLERDVFDVFDCAFGVVVVGLLYWRRPILDRLAAMAAAWRGRQMRSVAGASRSGLPGLLSTWLDQRGPDDRSE
jgi:uncharacterized membrane protein YhfC